MLYDAVKSARRDDLALVKHVTDYLVEHKAIEFDDGSIELRVGDKKALVYDEIKGWYLVENFCD